MMLGFKFQEHNLSAGPAAVKDGEIKGEVDQDMEKSASKTERASERHQEITDFLKKNQSICSKTIYMCVCNESNVTLQL